MTGDHRSAGRLDTGPTDRDGDPQDGALPPTGLPEGGGAGITAVTLDARRRLNLPRDLTAAAGLAGTVVVLPGTAPGELILATPAAALTRLHHAITAALAAGGSAGSLSTVLATRPGRDHTGPPGPHAGPLPAAGPILADTAVITAILDAAAAADPVVPLLPRLQLVEAVVDELLHTVLAAGLPLDGGPASFTAIMNTLTALGVTETGRDHAWAPVRVREYELTKAGVPTLAERVTLAVAATRDLPALLARPVPHTDTVPIGPHDYRTLATTTDTRA
ncbi:hypothetical protein [Actinoplanes subglobosus]|uniref:SpoVT-AbrB domain-containing protein n=1 Tax=Actinoplanes subglobosus TaxID=1547892 RepID=A0ABV8IRA1_9ACTN